MGGVNIRRAKHGRVPDKRRIGVDQAGADGVVLDEIRAEQNLAQPHRIERTVWVGDRPHEGFVGEAHMRVNHFKMALVDWQIDRLAHRAARMMDERAIVGELHKIAEILNRAIAAALVETMHEGRAVVGGKNG